MLTKLELKNFRVFGKADFKLKPLTILVGENGTGKSTVLYALCFLAQSLDQVNYRNSIDLRSFDETVRKGAESFEIGMEVEEEGKSVVLQEEFKEDGIKSVNISTSGKTSLKTEKEWIIKEVFKKQKSYSVEKAKEIEEIIDKEGIRFGGVGVLRFDIVGGGLILARTRESSKVEGLVGDIKA